MADTYKNFSELSVIEKKDIDFSIEAIDRGSRHVIIAIHGGQIEPMTTEIARAIARNELSFYSFVGKKNTEKENEDLHITSTHFDEPCCLDLVSRSQKVISIHGMAEHAEFIMVGGLDKQMIERVTNALHARSYVTRVAPESVNGNAAKNICNKCLSHAGIQLEIGRGLRDRFFNDPQELVRFSDIVRSTLE